MQISLRQGDAAAGLSCCDNAGQIKILHLCSTTNLPTYCLFTPRTADGHNLFAMKGKLLLETL
jgi:hypothetical protein